MKRDLTAEALRGTAIILLVIYHVVGHDSHVGLRVADDSWLRTISHYASYIRMPLFTFVSGYIYALRPYPQQEYFLKSKIMRLIVPMLIVGTLFAFVQSIVPSTNISLSGSAWLTLHIKPYAHFWFLEAIFLIFLLLMVLEKLKLLETLLQRLVIYAISILACIYLYEKMPDYFGFKEAFYLLPHFLTGYLYYHYQDKINKPTTLISIALVCFIGYIGIYLYNGHYGYVPRKTTVLGVVIGISFCVLLMSTKYKPRWVVFFGSYSFVIYLFHPFFTSAVRMFMHKLNISHNEYAVLCASSIAGLCIPIVMEMVLRRSPLAATLFLGKWKKPKSGAKQSSAIGTAYPKPR